MKTLKMHFASEKMLSLRSEHAETGLGFWILNLDPDVQNKIIIVLSDKFILPCFRHDTYFDINDYLNGNEWPVNGAVEDLSLYNSFEHRNAAANAVNQLNIPSHFTGITGAVPLIGRVKLPKHTKLVSKRSI